MIAIFRKELNHFFSSLIGYLSIGIFLLITGSLLWFFNGGVLDYGYATLESLFNLAPVVFLILIPAVTMRSFSEEKNMGTLELLMTKPLRDIDVILGKYLAALVLVVFSILPTLIYFYSVYKLGAPVGNIDTGGVWGSYIGLLFLGASFTAIGVFCSTLSSNQIVAFILSATICAAVYWLFDIIADFPLFADGLDYFIQQLGINAHYKSISRGIVDTRDIIYFLSVIVLFLGGTKTVLESRKW
jgi:ABC-2 type transport system permease protein